MSGKNVEIKVDTTNAGDYNPRHTFTRGNKMKDLIEFCADVAHDFCDGFMSRDELREIVAREVASDQVDLVTYDVAEALENYEVVIAD
jgi:hypothetical protein